MFLIGVLTENDGQSSLIGLLKERPANRVRIREELFDNLAVVGVSQVEWV